MMMILIGAHATNDESYKLKLPYKSCKSKEPHPHPICKYLLWTQEILHSSFLVNIYLHLRDGEHCVWCMYLPLPSFSLLYPPI